MGTRTSRHAKEKGRSGQDRERSRARRLLLALATRRSASERCLSYAIFSRAFWQHRPLRKLGAGDDTPAKGALVNEQLAVTLAHICARMNAPALRSARRPASSPPFHNGQAWIMCGQISSVTGTAAAPAAAARRTASSSSVSADPIWISIGGNPLSLA